VAYPLSNVLVDALPEESRRKLLKQVTRVNVPTRTSLYEPGDPPKFAHFLTPGIASVVTTMGDGSTSEVGTLGREGVPQALHLLGELRVPTRCFMQISGTGLRVEFGVLQRLFEADEALRRISRLHAVLKPHARPSRGLQPAARCNRTACSLAPDDPGPHGKHPAQADAGISGRDDRLAKNNGKRSRWWVAGPGPHRICSRIDQDSRQDRTRKRELRMLSHNQKLTHRRLQACPSTCV
jgi:hypothetical protein